MDSQQDNSSLNLPPIGRQYNLSQLPLNDSALTPTPDQPAIIATNPLPPSAANNSVASQQQNGGTNKTGLTSVPTSADDVDLIEKEWIAKIEEIIHHTSSDPYERSRQLALLKAEYLQKRYNRTINPNQ